MLLVFGFSIYFCFVQIFSNIKIESLIDLRLIQNNVINVMIVHVAIIIDKLQKLGYDKKSAFELLLKIGAFQGAVCLLGIIIPFFKDIAVYLYQSTGGNNQFVIESRVYGISGDYTFGTPIYHGLLAGLAVYETIKDKRRHYLIYIILIALAAALNGRTGIVAFVVFALLSIIYLLIKKRKAKKAAIIFASLVVTIFLMTAIIQQISPKSYEYINNFVIDTKNLIFEQELTGNYKVLLEDGVRFPAGSGLIFGEGYRVYGVNTQGGFKSDIGYVNDLFMGGMIFVIAIYGSVIYFLLRRSGDELYFFSLIVLVTLIVNFKGEIFRSSIFLFLILYVKMLALSDMNSNNSKQVQ